MIDTKLELAELLELQRMLNAGKEDFEIAVSNIINLNLDSVYVKLLSKGIQSHRRRDYLNKFGFDNLSLLSFDNIYDEIKTNPELIGDETLKTYFFNCVTDLVYNSVDSLGLPIDGVHVKVKWPKNAKRN